MTTGVTRLTSDDMGRMRTAMASDRTLMAWVRTALSMISFGFTVYKFFQYLYQNRPHDPVPASARNMAVMLAGLALLGLTAGLVDHRRTAKHLGEFRPQSFWGSFAVLIALAVAGLAGLLFVSALWRGPL